MTVNTDSTPDASTAAPASPDRRVPTLVAVEGTTYVFFAVLEDPTLAGPSNWVAQTFRVDPTNIDDGEGRVRVVERYHVDGRERAIAFEDRFTATVSLEMDESKSRPQVSTVQRALAQWYRCRYLDETDAEP